MSKMCLSMIRVAMERLPLLGCLIEVTRSKIPEKENSNKTSVIFLPCTVPVAEHVHCSLDPQALTKWQIQRPEGFPQFPLKPTFGTQLLLVSYLLKTLVWVNQFSSYSDTQTWWPGQREGITYWWFRVTWHHIPGMSGSRPPLYHKPAWPEPGFSVGSQAI